MGLLKEKIRVVGLLRKFINYQLEKEMLPAHRMYGFLLLWPTW